MRISDWSSDVCSSDLRQHDENELPHRPLPENPTLNHRSYPGEFLCQSGHRLVSRPTLRPTGAAATIPRKQALCSTGVRRASPTCPWARFDLSHLDPGSARARRASRSAVSLSPMPTARLLGLGRQDTRTTERTSVVRGKSVSVRGDLGGRTIDKKNKNTQQQQ